MPSPPPPSVPRRRRAAALLAGALVAAGAAVALGAESEPAAAETTFRFEGRGFGHGVGMSQYGARGAALRGLDAGAILAHYYRGTQIARVPTTGLRVRVAEERLAAVVSSTRPIRARVGAGGRAVRLGGGVPFRVSVASRAVHIQTLAGRLRLRGGEAVTLTPAPGASVRVDGRGYRGAVQLVAVGASRLDVVNAVGLEQYLQGVIPGEVPASWGDQTPEALRAQAIAARSYSLASRAPGRHFDLHADVRSQVYGGRDGEDPRTTAAVRATRGQVLTHGGAIITAFYFSTSGGRTENVEHVFGGDPQPYLVSVADPFDSPSPYHRRWPDPPTVGAARLGALLELGAPVRSLTVTRRGASPRVISALVRTADGRAHQVSGAEVRRAVGLRDTWFRVVTRRSGARTPERQPERRSAAGRSSGRPTD